MRLRGMHPGDRPALVELYGGRTRTAAGLMRRNPAYWRRRLRSRGGKGIRVVAEDRGRLAGYALASIEDGVASIREVMWRTEYDGTGLGERLLREALRRAGRRNPCSVGANAMAGSPLLPLLRGVLGHERPVVSLFMAGAVDARALLRDAVRVVVRRRGRAVRLRVGARSAVAGSGPVAATVALDANVLLGLLLGVRDVHRELRRGGLTVAPRTPTALAAAQAALSPRTFWIADAW